MKHLRLLQLLEQNRKPFQPIESRIVAKGKEASIYLYDPIVGSRAMAEWYGGVCPQDFNPALRALDAEKITLYTNCPGGDVFAAEAMCQAIREHGAYIEMQIEGYAASAATSIACACDKVSATKGSKYMIHQSWTFGMGNADDFEQLIDLLRKCDNTMFDEYAAKTGQDRQKIIDWCKAETWFTAEEAKQYGFVDEVLMTGKSSTKASAWNLSAYFNPPEPDSAPEPEPQEPAPEPQTISDEHRARQQQRLNLLNRI